MTDALSMVAALCITRTGVFNVYRSDISSAWLSAHRQDRLADYPFGTDFTDIEQYLNPALAQLCSAGAHRSTLFKLVLTGMKGEPAAREKEALGRMDLVTPKGFVTRLVALALKGALRKGDQG